VPVRELLTVSSVPRGVHTRWLSTLSALLQRRLKIRRPISIAFVSARMMKRLNTSYRGVNATTDVLSFTLHEPQSPEQASAPLGEIIISLPDVRRQARTQGHSLAEEFQVLTIHGVLHVLGYEHDGPAGARRMRKLETGLLGELKKTLAKH